MAANGFVREALGDLDARLDHWKRTLVDLCRIPSISAAGFPPEEVRRSAQAVAKALRDAAMEHVEVLEIPGVHPYVYGDWLHRPGAPTVLLYGHHDVMPPGRAEKWLSPAFEPTERGGRLYGRGTADDKGGVMAHVAAVGSYLRVARTRPLNVKFIIEGEEEVGSRNLGRFLEQYRTKIAADFIVLTDTRNYDVGHPALTYQLRGICQVDVEVQGLHQPLHSGLSGPVPDPVQILCAMIADLRKPNGALNVPGLYAKVARPSAKQLTRIRKLPLSEAKFKKDSGMLPGVRLWGREPVLAARAHVDTAGAHRDRAGGAPAPRLVHQIIEAARARLSLRTVPGMDAREAGRLIVRKLTTRPSYGVKVTAKINGATPWWTTDPEGPAFEAARGALKAGFGKETAMVGAGGTIGFVQPFAALLKGAPCILMGVAGPNTQAHSENESLHLGDWVKAMRSTIHLYDALARLPRR